MIIDGLAMVRLIACSLSLWCCSMTIRNVAIMLDSHQTFTAVMQTDRSIVILLTILNLVLNRHGVGLIFPAGHCIFSVLSVAILLEVRLISTRLVSYLQRCLNPLVRI